MGQNPFKGYPFFTLWKVSTQSNKWKTISFLQVITILKLIQVTTLAEAVKVEAIQPMHLKNGPTQLIQNHVKWLNNNLLGLKLANRYSHFLVQKFTTRWQMSKSRLICLFPNPTQVPDKVGPRKKLTYCYQLFVAKFEYFTFSTVRDDWNNMNCSFLNFGIKCC